MHGWDWYQKASVKHTYHVVTTWRDRELLPSSLRIKSLKNKASATGKFCLLPHTELFIKEEMEEPTGS